MTIQRVSTYALHQNTLGDVSKIQTNIANLQDQISSGKKTDTFDGLGTKVEHFVSLEEKIAKSDSYIANNSVILARVQTTQRLMENIISLVDDMEDLMLAARSSSSGEALQFDSQIIEKRNQLRDVLNTKFEGRSLFGGTNTSAAPVTDVPITLTAGVPDTSYYNGSSEDVTARIDDNIQIRYGVRADAEGFQKVFAAIGQALNSNSASDSELENAFSLIQEGLQDIIGEQTAVNANIVQIQEITTRHQDLKLYWKGVSESLINTDIVAVSTQLAVDQTILQASFQSFASLNRLRLVDFL